MNDRSPSGAMRPGLAMRGDPAGRLAASERDRPDRPWPAWLADGTGLSVVFQPIFATQDGALLGFEGLIRGPAGTAFESPAALFDHADSLGAFVRLERLAARCVVAAFVEQALPGQLFLNLSCDAMLELADERMAVLDELGAVGLAGDRVVVELTEHRANRDLDRLVAAVAAFRGYGGTLALDDYGTANSSLQLALALRPEIIKIDKWFVAKMTSSVMHDNVIRAIQELGERNGSRLVAEGVEDVQTLARLRAIGVTYAQGYLLARPTARPATTPAAQALACLQAPRLPPPPVERMRRGMHEPVGRLVMRVAPVVGSDTVDTVRDRLLREPGTSCLAVLDGDRVVGLVERQAFMDRYAQPYVRELFGARALRDFLGESSPIVVEHDTPIDALAERHAALATQGRPPSFIVTDRGRYVGVGRFAAVLERMAERNIEAARHANPLTLLPGQVPTEQHVQRLLDVGRPFVVGWCDLDHFKAFNDRYGWRRGDQALLLVADSLSEACGQSPDHLGHLGGDDFLIVLQGGDAVVQARRAAEAFARRAALLYDAPDHAAGGIVADDRRGVRRLHPLMRLSIGMLAVRPSDGLTLDGIAARAARLKSSAKQDAEGIVLRSAEESGSASERRSAEECFSGP